MAKGGYQRQRLNAKKDAERKARKRARRNKVLLQWGIGIAVLAMLGTVLGVTLTGGKKKPAANPSNSASPVPTVTATRPPPYYLIPGCTKPSSAKPNGKTFTKAPPMTIDKNKTYIVTFKTTCGPMVWKLDAKKAPATVNNIVFLINQRYFDNTTIPRVNATSSYAIIQGGTQNGTISGGVAYTYPGETPAPSAKYLRGTLAMANSNGPSTNGSQWFVVVKDWAGLPPNYTIFGAVTGAASFATLDRMIKAKGIDIPDGQGGSLGTTPNPSIKIISATVTVA